MTSSEKPVKAKVDVRAKIRAARQKKADRFRFGEPLTMKEQGVIQNWRGLKRSHYEQLVRWRFNQEPRKTRSVQRAEREAFEIMLDLDRDRRKGREGWARRQR